MATDKTDSPEQPTPVAIQASSKEILDEVISIKNLAEEQLKAIEESRKKFEEEACKIKNGVEEINSFKKHIEENIRLAEANITKTIEEMLAPSKALNDELVRYKIQIEEHLKAAEVSRKKADDEATYASQAKNNSETHAKAVSTFKGQAEAEFTTITTNRQKSEELLQVITVANATTSNAVNEISENRKKVEKATLEVVEAGEKGTSRLTDIETAKTSASEASRESEKMRDEAIQMRNKIDADQKEINQFAQQASGLVGKISEFRTTAESSTTEINENLNASKDDTTELAKVLRHLEKSDEIATGFETRLTKSSEDLAALIKKVDDLLPGATSASLASSFSKQKNRFDAPQKRWLTTFIWCIIGLIIISLPSFFHAVLGDGLWGGQKTTWDDVWRGFAMRLPVVVPLAWLAIYAGRNYMLSLRLEEDYAYKEAISISFEGYKREMAQITAGDITNPTPITTLCINVLRAIAERPGRIYEGKQQDISLASEFKTAIDQAKSELRKRDIAEIQ